MYKQFFFRNFFNKKKNDSARIHKWDRKRLFHYNVRMYYARDTCIRVYVYTWHARRRHNLILLPSVRPLNGFINTRIIQWYSNTQYIYTHTHTVYAVRTRRVSKDYYYYYDYEIWDLNLPSIFFFSVSDHHFLSFFRT